MPPMLPHEILLCIAGITLGAIGLYLLPSCGEPDCVESHKRHSLAERSATIAKTHMAFHDRLHPSPTCALCADRKRDDPPDQGS